MTDSDSRVVVLAAIDEGLPAQRVAAASAALATERGAELHFVHVVPWIPTNATPAERAAHLDASSLVEDARAKLDDVARTSGFGARITCHISIGDPAREILQLAARIETDTIVCGSHNRHGIQRVLLGSVAERVVRGASCPVLVIRDKDYETTLAPEIEPACAACIATQRDTRGASLWCARHAEKHPQPSLHYEYPAPFGLGSMLVREA